MTQPHWVYFKHRLWDTTDGGQYCIDQVNVSVLGRYSIEVVPTDRSERLSDVWDALAHMITDHTIYQARPLHVFDEQ
jgi:hypothetical protein